MIKKNWNHELVIKREYYSGNGEGVPQVHLSYPIKKENGFLSLMKLIFGWNRLKRQNVIAEKIYERNMKLLDYGVELNLEYKAYNERFSLLVGELNKLTPKTVYLSESEIVMKKVLEEKLYELVDKMMEVDKSIARILREVKRP